MCKRRNKREGRKEQNFLHVTESSLHDCSLIKDFLLSVLQELKQIVANWLAWGHTHLSLAPPTPVSPPKLHSQLLVEPQSGKTDQAPLAGGHPTCPPWGAHHLQAAQTCPRPRLPLQVLGCGSGSRMVLEAAWEDSGLGADSPAASGCGGSPSVTGRAHVSSAGLGPSHTWSSSHTLGPTPHLIFPHPFHRTRN